MPRKNQGLRAYHHKSRDGCTLCKHRRVKCDMQQPSCANCVRRDETCQYLNDFNGESSRSQHVDNSSNTYASTDGSPRQSYNAFMIRNPAFEAAAGALHTRDFDAGYLNNTIENNVNSEITTNGTLRSLLDQSWFSPPEILLWSAALRGTLTRYQSVGHCILSLAYLRQDLQNNSRSGPGTFAYHHHVAASELFRRDIPAVNENNWIPAISFHISTLIFLFSTQSFCPESDFDLAGTLHILKHGNVMGAQVAPYLRHTVMWSHIQRRTVTPNTNDHTLQSNLEALGKTIAEYHHHHVRLGIHVEKSEAIRGAFVDLCRWAISCFAHPRRWDQYCAWPSLLSAEYFDSITAGDEAALVLIVYWCAILYRAPQPSVYLWAYRAAHHVMRRRPYRDAWQDLLRWPKQALTVPREGSLWGFSRLSLESKIS